MISSRHTLLAGDDTPLLISGIQPDLQHTECLERPEKKPWLARILTRVPLRETLDEVPYKKLHVYGFVQCGCCGVILHMGLGWILCLQLRLGEMFEEDGFCLGLCLGCCSRKGICWCWSRLRWGDHGVNEWRKSKTIKE